MWIDFGGLIFLSTQIYVGGPTLARGYLNRPELNRERFISTPESLREKLSGRLYKTGDWGYMLSDGSFEICGRCDTMVKIRGYSIEKQVRVTNKMFICDRIKYRYVMNEKLTNAQKHAFSIGQPDPPPTRGRTKHGTKLMPKFGWFTTPSMTNLRIHT